MRKFGIRFATLRGLAAVISLAAIVSAVGTVRVMADDIPARLAAYMDAAVKVEKFSGSVLVAKEGNVVFARGYGLANAEHQVPNTPDTKFRLGSVTKQFTAAAILILQDQGKLKVEDLIGKHLEDSPQAWEKVTIHHLLTHTSGVPSYTEDVTYRLLMYKPELVSSMIARFKEKPLSFEPGSKFHYSNSGYFLLGAIIEKVSQTSYEAFLKDAIFDPLGMRDTGYDRPETVLLNRAAGYERHSGEFVNATYLDMSQPFSAGALYSTVNDMLKWDRALHERKLLSKDSMAAMFTPFKDGYAYGWGIGEQHGHKRVGHGGGINGFATDFQRYPDDEVCVTVLSNVMPSSPSKISRDLASILFGQPVSTPKVREVAKVDPKIYDAYVGKYELGPNFVLTVTREGDHLMTQATGQGKIEVFPESETHFFLRVVDAQLTFVREDDKVTHLILHQNGSSRKAPRIETTTDDQTNKK
jgi:CubicO group peptidase (beta-lactamase class C family)